MVNVLSNLSQAIFLISCLDPLHKKAIIHQVTTTLATSKNVLLLGHNHLLTTGFDDLTL